MINYAGLGNDPIGIVYDGIRNTAHLTPTQLGDASNLVNIALIILLALIGRKYIHLGTLIYILPYGFFVNIGSAICNYLIPKDIFSISIITSIFGCMLLYFGVAIFITVDIGLDPFTGIVMVIRDKLGWEYKYAKIMFDISMVILGTLLGGRLGVFTVITALAAGPVIQRLSIQMKKVLHKKS